MSNWFRDIEIKIAAGIEHGIDNWLDATFAHNAKPTDVEAKVNAYLESSPLVHLLGGMGMLAIPIVEGEIDSLIEHNDNATALQKVKDYIHARLKVK